MDDCTFCKILDGEIPAGFVYRDDDIAVIEDVNPQAPHHLLVMPVRHCANLADFVSSQPSNALAKLFDRAVQTGREFGPDGFRTIINTGSEAGQTVEHLHIHILAGKPMQ